MRGLGIKKLVVIVLFLTVIFATFNVVYAGAKVIQNEEDTQEEQTPEISTELMTEDEVEVPTGGEAIIPGVDDVDEETSIEDEDVALDSGTESDNFRYMIILFFIVGGMLLASAIIINNNKKTKMNK